MKKLIIISPIIFLLSFQSSKYDIEHGKKLFTANCSMCHHATKAIVGPPFQFIRKDLDTTWIFNFIRNHNSVVTSDDIRAKYVYRIWNRTTVYENYSYMTNDDIIAILNYIDSLPGYTPKYYNHRKLSLSEISSILSKLNNQVLDIKKEQTVLDSLAGR